MDEEKAIFLGVFGLFLLFYLPIIVAPFFPEKIFNDMHSFYAPFCHQYAGRSLCYTDNKGVIECSAHPSFTEEDYYTKKALFPEKEGWGKAYKFPVCTRDLFFYSGMVLSFLIYYAKNRKNLVQTAPTIYFLIMAILPMGVDGGGQLLGLWESTNLSRAISGFLAGIPLAFYIMPVIYKLTGKLNKKEQ